MGDRDDIGVSTGEAREAAVSAATLADQYEVIDLHFRAVIAGVGVAVVEAAVRHGVLTFCETHLDDLIRLRAHIREIGQGAAEAGQAAAEADRGNVDRFAQSAV